MSWLEDFGYDIIFEEMEVESENYLVANQMTQTELVVFLSTHIENLEINPSRKEELSFLKLVKNILDQADRRELSEKQRNVLNSFYSKYVHVVCLNYGEDCSTCHKGSKAVNKLNFLKVIKEDEEKKIWENIQNLDQKVLADFLADNKEMLPDNKFKDMTLDIIEKAKLFELSEKQRKILNNTYYYNFF